MIKAVVFDLWGTLFYESTQKEHPFRKFARLIGQDLSDYKYLKVFETYLMLKKNYSLRKPVLQILTHFGIVADEKLISELIRLLEKKGIIEDPYPETFKVLGELRARGYKLALITNTYYTSYKRVNKKFNLGKYFDIVLKSYETGMLKPDPKVFELVLSKLNTSKKETLMVGDSLEDDVRAAEKFGIKGVLVDRNNKHSNYSNRIVSLDGLENFF